MKQLQPCRPLNLIARRWRQKNMGVSGNCHFFTFMAAILIMASTMLRQEGDVCGGTDHSDGLI
jgi:hypothetical protein